MSGRGRKPRGITREVQMSKTLSWILRHGANEVGIALDEDGFASVDEILSLPQLRGTTVPEVQAAVANNEKQRFVLKTSEDGLLWIRANQGHSLPVFDFGLRPISDPTLYPTVVHGTKATLWDTIRHTGLSRMKRQHIHFAKGLPGESGVITGMRTSCDLYIYVDLPRVSVPTQVPSLSGSLEALEAGLKFLESPNGAVLSPGDQDGFLRPQFFSRVVRTVDGHQVQLL